jgi:phospholipid/cholesterol/gamma-HCH transport system ATP-binding protein
MNSEDNQISHAIVSVKGVSLAYGDYVVLRNVTFNAIRGQALVVMGGSGCGKSTLLKSLIGLLEPVSGSIRYGDQDFWASDNQTRDKISRRFGILYQGGALWSSMSLLENVSLPLEMYTELSPKEVREIAEYKLSLVGLSGFGDFRPAQLSGGMRKRGGLARAMSLDPEILFFDEPSAGLDPLSSRRLDDLILELKETLGITFIVVTHELPSIFAIADDSIFLDAETKTLLACGHPATLRDECPEEKVRRFLLTLALRPMLSCY